MCPWNRVTSVTRTKEYKQAYGSVEPYHDDPVTESQQEEWWWWLCTESD